MSGHGCYDSIIAESCARTEEMQLPAVMEIYKYHCDRVVLTLRVGC